MTFDQQSAQAIPGTAFIHRSAIGRSVSSGHELSTIFSFGLPIRTNSCEKRVIARLTAELPEHLTLTSILAPVLEIPNRHNDDHHHYHNLNPTPCCHAKRIRLTGICRTMFSGDFILGCRLSILCVIRSTEYWPHDGADCC
jgi:hypothetical protein